MITGTESQSSALGHSDEAASFAALLCCRHTLVLQEAEPLAEGHSSLIEKRTMKMAIRFTTAEVNVFPAADLERIGFFLQTGKLITG